MAWLQVRIHTTRPEFAEELLLAHGAQAVSYVDAHDDPVLEPAPGETPLWKETVTLGLFPEQTDVAPLLATLREILPEGVALKTGIELVEDQDWIRVWLKDCTPLQFGERLWIAPREKAHEVKDPEAVVVRLDPGLAFGTGTHPSTALCLDWLAHHQLAGKSVLDYGCGSGILAVAALKLGAAKATCADIDPQAITATRGNAAENEVARRLAAIEPTQEFVPFPADVVVANILARPLIELAPLLAASIKQGGSLVLAGLLENQADDVIAAYARWIDFDRPALKDGWARLSGRCRMPALINSLRISDRLTTAGQPRREHFPLIAQDGTDAVINLAPGSSPNALTDEAELWRELRIQYFHIPVPWEQPADENLREFFAAMDALAERKVFVHCALNKRVSAFVFLYRVLKQGVAIAEAQRDLHRIWEPNPSWRTFIERTLARHQHNAVSQ
jgi:ribosomal protein L11 methyltransferase